MTTGQHRAPRVLVALLLIAVLVPVVANAARIGLVGGGRPLTRSMERCTDSALTVSPVGTGSTSTRVTVSGLAPKAGAVCAVGAVRVLSTSTGAVQYAGTGTPAATFTTTAGAAFTPPSTATGRVSVMIDGWAVPAVWQNARVVGSCAAPAAAPFAAAVLASAGAPCTVTALTLSTWENAYYQVAVTVTNTSTRAVVWSLALDLSSRPAFPAIAPTSFAGIRFDSSWNAYTQDPCASLPVVLLVGRADWGQAELDPGESRRFSFQVSSLDQTGSEWWSCA